MLAKVTTVIGLLLASCHHAPSQPKADVDELEVKAAEYRAHLVQRSLCGGWVATRVTGDIGCYDLGDSLLFSGLALAVLPCAEGDEVLQAVAASQDERQGLFVRYEPLSPQYAGNENSRDGITGLIFGLTVRAAHCPADRPRLADMWRRYRAALGPSPVALYPGNLNAIVTPAFAAVLQQADRVLAGGEGPSFTRRIVWEAAASQGAQDATAHREACYGIHLATLQAILFGSSASNDFHKAFCVATAGAGLALTDWYCGAGAEAVKSWLSNYQPNLLVYSHQRCTWETEIPRPGSDGPALDWLVLYTLAKEGSYNGWH